MRAKLTGLGGLLLIGGAVGCFNAVSELDEAEAVAEALTRGMHFNGGAVRDGNLPDTTAQDVVILAPGLPSVMSPGQASLMGFDLDDQGDSENPVEATLVQFDGSRKHILVNGGSADHSSGSPWHYEHSFDVAPDVCNGLCNKKHSVKMRVGLKLRDGRISRAQTVNLTLDCSEDGDSNACDTGHGGSIANVPFLQGCQHSAGICASFASEHSVPPDVAECVAVYECVQVYYSGDSLCQSLVESLVECMADASTASECDQCSSITDELGANCTFPEVCLSIPSTDLDAGVGPVQHEADASRPEPAPVDLLLTDSLVQNCALLCDLAQQQACPNFSDTCQQDCEGGFAGGACESPLVQLQRCAWDMSGQTFSCDDSGSPVFSSAGAAMCPGETQKFSDCVINNPDVLPTGTDAGLPAGSPDAGF